MQSKVSWDRKALVGLASMALLAGSVQASVEVSLVTSADAEVQGETGTRWPNSWDVDTVINDQSATNFGSSDYLNALQRGNGSAGEIQNKKFYVQFEIPAQYVGREVLSADLQFYWEKPADSWGWVVHGLQENAGGYGTNAATSEARLGEDWDESLITWNNAPGNVDPVWTTIEYKSAPSVDMWYATYSDPTDTSNILTADTTPLYMYGKPRETGDPEDPYDFSGPYPFAEKIQQIAGTPKADYDANGLAIASGATDATDALVSFLNADTNGFATFIITNHRGSDLTDSRWLSKEGVANNIDPRTGLPYELDPIAPTLVLTFADAVDLPGDLNGDGFVGIDDLNIVLGNWNQNVPPANPLADPSGDGFVGIDDLNEVLGNWNTGTPPAAAAAVPEPSAIALLSLGALGLVRRRVVV